MSKTSIIHKIAEHIRRFHTAYWVLVIGLSASLAMSVWLHSTVADHQKAMFRLATEDTFRILDLYFTRDLKLLSGLKALFDAHNLLEADQVQTYLRSIGFFNNSGAIGNVGVCTPLLASSPEALQNAYFKKGFHRFLPSALKARKETLPILLWMDSSHGRLDGAGWEAFNSPRIQQAMSLAQDSGTPAATLKVPLRTSANSGPLNGFIIFYPLYTTPRTPPTVVERRRQCVGFIFGTFPSDPLWGNMLRAVTPRIMSFSVYDSPRMQKEDLLFNFNKALDDKTKTSSSSSPKYTTLQAQNALGRPWYYLIRSRDPLNQSLEDKLPMLCLAGGVLVSLFLFVVEMRGFQQSEKLMTRVGAAGTALQEEKDMLAVTLRSIVDGVITTEVEGHITLMNLAAERLTGWPQHLAAGLPVASVFKVRLQSNESGPIPDFNEVLRSGKTFDSTPPLIIVDRNGKQRTISAGVAPIRDKVGTARGLVIVFRDITERQRLENQLRHAQKMEAFGQLAGGVAHDFNNILTVIQSHAALMQTEDANSTAIIESAKEIQQATERAASLTRQLLTFSRRGTIQLADIDLNDIVSNMMKMLQRIIGDHVSLEARYMPQKAMVRADAGMMEQVLMNLAVNSRDAMPKGGRLMIETTSADFDATTLPSCNLARPGQYIRLSVSDTGTGITPENLPRIFEPFFTTKEIGKGTGLGLATVLGIVEQNSGWIDVQSQVGMGTTFHIYLPRQEHPLSTVRKTSGNESPGGTETILLVEDEPAVRALALHLLQRKGYRVLEAGNGPQAVEIWKRNAETIDLLLTDMLMPGGIMGMELAQKLRKENPSLKVILSSGYQEEISSEETAHLEGCFFLQKPYPPSRLAQCVRRCLDSESPTPSEKL